MSGAPLPKPETDPAPEPGVSDADGWALLEALRRRIDDQSAQGRKTQLQVTQLAESIGSLVEIQHRREKSLNLSSFVAYVLFTLLVGSGFYLLYRSRATELADARQGITHERDAAVRRADEASAKIAAREQADHRAWEVYQLLETGKRSDAVGKLSQLGDLPLSRTERAVLAARAHETQVIEVDTALKAAAIAFKAGRHADVIAPLEAALVGEAAGPRGAAIHYFLGVAYAKANDLVNASTHLQIAVISDVEHEDARFQLASVLDRAGQYSRARVEYDRFATAHPQSALAVFAMRRSGTLARMPAVAPNALIAGAAMAAPTVRTAAAGATMPPPQAPTASAGSAAATATARTPQAATGTPRPTPTGAAPIPAPPAAAAPTAAPAAPTARPPPARRAWTSKPAPKKPVPAPAPAEPITPPANPEADTTPLSTTPSGTTPWSAIERADGSAIAPWTIDSFERAARPPATNERAPRLALPAPSSPIERTSPPWPAPDPRDLPAAPTWNASPEAAATIGSQPLRVGRSPLAF